MRLTYPALAKALRTPKPRFSESAEALIGLVALIWDSILIFLPSDRLVLVA